MAEAGFWFVLLACLDGLCVFAIIMGLLGKDNSGKYAWIFSSVVFLGVTLFVAINYLCFRWGWQKRKRLREALADGIAVEEQVEGKSAHSIETGDFYQGSAWIVLPTAEGPILAVDLWGASLGPLTLNTFAIESRACWERVTTRIHELPLSLKVVGRSVLPVVNGTDDTITREIALRRGHCSSFVLPGTSNAPNHHIPMGPVWTIL